MTLYAKASTLAIGALGLAGLVGYQVSHQAPPVELAEGTALSVRVDSTLSSGVNQSGEVFSGSLVTPVTMNSQVVLPAGTRVYGHVTQSKSSGRLRGRGAISVQLDSFELNGKKHEVVTNTLTRVTGSHKKRNLALIGGGSGAGALIGGIASGGKGALIGAGAGAGAGTVGALITGKKQAVIPSESALQFKLQEPVTVSAKDIRAAAETTAKKES